MSNQESDESSEEVIVSDFELIHSILSENTSEGEELGVFFKELEFGMEGNDEDVHGKRINTILFFQTRDVCVFCVSDGSLRFSDFNTQIMFDKYKVENENVSTIMKWSDESFIASGRKFKIFEFMNEPLVEDPGEEEPDRERTVRRMKKSHAFKVTEISLPEESVLPFSRMARISDDLFLSLDVTSGNIFVISCSKLKEIRRMERPLECTGHSMMVLSKTNSNHFYINSYRSIGLVDHENNFFVLKEFGDIGEAIYTITTFTNYKNEEILVAGGYQEIIYFYNAHSGGGGCFKEIMARDSVCTSWIIQNKILAVFERNLVFYDIQDSFKEVLRVEELDDVLDLNVVEKNNERNEIRILTSSRDSHKVILNKLRSRNFEFPDDEMFRGLDQQDRVVFLLDILNGGEDDEEEEEDVIFFDGVENNMLEFKIGFSSSFNIFKFLLL